MRALDSTESATHIQYDKLSDNFDPGQLAVKPVILRAYLLQSFGYESIRLWRGCTITRYAMQSITLTMFPDRRARRIHLPSAKLSLYCSMSIFQSQYQPRKKYQPMESRVHV
jgi:hypothetical protein